MKKVIFWLMTGVVFGLGFWMGFRANNPNPKTEVLENSPKVDVGREAPLKQSLKTRVNQLNFSEKEVRAESKKEVKMEMSEVEKRLTELGFSATKFHKVVVKN